ncbi:unnamed protein product [Eruca vesicaria subsp. sativa]|uniref:Uncharacterized protein n=1 Tax=Eruca vesicaria subsp. sativa TaxID=29727 RepID=A0ABC8L2Z1_ERUVS|nr:unnamed protein product [Eruca vesicaria subsp. sativa]
MKSVGFHFSIDLDSTDSTSPNGDDDVSRSRVATDTRRHNLRYLGHSNVFSLVASPFAVVVVVPCPLPASVISFSSIELRANGRTDKEWKKLLPYLRSCLGEDCNIRESLTSGPSHAIDITREVLFQLCALIQAACFWLLLQLRDTILMSLE